MSLSRYLQIIFTAKHLQRVVYIFFQGLLNWLNDYAFVLCLFHLLPAFDRAGHSILPLAFRRHTVLISFLFQWLLYLRVQHIIYLTLLP